MLRIDDNVSCKIVKNISVTQKHIQREHKITQNLFTVIKQKIDELLRSFFFLATLLQFYHLSSRTLC